MFWHKVAVPLYQKTIRVMRNTDYNASTLCGFLSSDASFQALRDLIDDLGLEVEKVTAL